MKDVKKVTDAVIEELGFAEGVYFTYTTIARSACTCRCCKKVHFSKGDLVTRSNTSKSGSSSYTMCDDCINGIIAEEEGAYKHNANYSNSLSRTDINADIYADKYASAYYQVDLGLKGVRCNAHTKHYSLSRKNGYNVNIQVVRKTLEANSKLVVNNVVIKSTDDYLALTKRKC